MLQPPRQGGDRERYAEVGDRRHTKGLDATEAGCFDPLRLVHEIRRADDRGDTRILPEIQRLGNQGRHDDAERLR